MISVVIIDNYRVQSETIIIYLNTTELCGINFFIFKNMEPVFVKYFRKLYSEADWDISSVGFEEILPDSPYPTQRHSTEYYFDLERGRILKDYQLVYITKGEGILKTKSGGVFSIKKGMMFVLFPGEWHTYYPNHQTGWSHYWIGFSGSYVDKWMANGWCSKKKPVFKVGINDEIVFLFRKAIDVAGEEKTFYKDLLQGLVTYLITLMCSIDKNSSVVNNVFFEKINYTCILMRELIDQPVSMEDIAKRSGLGYSHFRKLFKEQMNCAPIQYFQELKIQKGIDYLTTTSISIKEIAYRLNFSSVAYFSVCFKKKTGMSPKEYRNEFGAKKL